MGDDPRLSFHSFPHYRTFVAGCASDISMIGEIQHSAGDFSAAESQLFCDLRYCTWAYALDGFIDIPLGAVLEGTHPVDGHDITRSSSIHP